MRQSFVAVAMLLFFLPGFSSAMLLTKAQPTGKTATVDSSANNIPTTFSTAAGSNVINGLKNLYYSHLACLNGSSSDVVVAYANPGVTPTLANHICPANAFVVFDDSKVLDGVYLQSDTGSTISSGKVKINVY